MPKPIQLTEDQIDQLVESYQAGASLEKAAEPLGLGKRATKKALVSRGLRARSVGAAVRKYQFNEQFFDVIDSEEKAYWLGFITADGCILRSRCNKEVPVGFKLSLKGSDIGHLEKLSLALSSSARIKKYDADLNGKKYPSVSVDFYSRHLAESLGRLGVHPAKSLTVKPCDSIPEDLRRHYWRGLVDGDGSLLKHKGRTTWIFRCLGTYDVIKGFVDFLEANSIQMSSKTFKKKHVWVISISGNAHVKEVADLLWGDSTVFLDRKKKKHEQLMNEPSIYQNRSGLTKEDLLHLRSVLSTWASVAEALGTSCSHLGRLKKKLGISQRKKPFDPTSVTKEDLLALYDRLGTWAKVSEHLGIFDSYMYKLKKRFNI